MYGVIGVLSFFKSLYRRKVSPQIAPGSASVPAGICVYAVGDIHGELALLKKLIKNIFEDSKKKSDELGLKPVLIFLGDYVDRGVDSKGVLDFLIALKAGSDQAGLGCHFLKGNHEAALTAFLADPVQASDWLRFGGIETLASYGIRFSVGVFEAARCRQVAKELAAAMPPQHHAFLDQLETRRVIGDYLFVHAGLRPGVPVERQKEDDFLWIREPFLSSRRCHGKIVVHGHTIVRSAQDFGNRIAVDTGAYASGRLSAAVLHLMSRQLISVE